MECDEELSTETAFLNLFSEDIFNELVGAIVLINGVEVNWECPILFYYLNFIQLDHFLYFVVV